VSAVRGDELCGSQQRGSKSSTKTGKMITRNYTWVFIQVRELRRFHLTAITYRQQV